MWTANQVSDTSRYVANVEPLIKDPAIQNALTDKLTSEIVTRINVKGLTDQAAAALAQKGLPRVSTLLQSFSGSLASGVQGFVHTQIHKIITGPRMANAWVQVNRVASQALVAVLSGRAASNGAVGVRNGQVTLDLAPLIAVAKQDLVARGLTIAGKIPIVHATFALFPSKNLAKAQKAYRLINDLKIVLPDRDARAAQPGRAHRAAPPAGTDRCRARVRRVHAGARRRPADRPESLPEQRARERVRGRGRRCLRHLGPVHQDGASHPAGRRPDRGRGRVLHRAVRGGGANPPRVVVWPGPATPRRRIRTGLAGGRTRTVRRSGSGRWRWPR